MVDTPGGGQAITPVAPGAGAENQGAGGGADPTKIATPAAPSPGSGAPSLDAGSKNAQLVDSIKLGDNVFTAAQVEAVLKAKAGLETANAAMKTKLEELETADLSDKDKAVKEAERLTAENAALKQRVLNAAIQTKLDAAGVQLKADMWNHGVTEESAIDEAVQKLIKENPGIVKAGGPAAPGVVQPPVGSVPPTQSPGAGDAEAELMQKYNAAAAAGDGEMLKKLDQEYFDLRGGKPPGGGQPI